MVWALNWRLSVDAFKMFFLWDEQYQKKTVHMELCLQLDASSTWYFLILPTSYENLRHAASYAILYETNLTPSYYLLISLSLSLTPFPLSPSTKA